MLQNAYFLAKIGADTAKNEQHFADILCTILAETGNYPTRPPSGAGLVVVAGVAVLALRFFVADVVVVPALRFVVLVVEDVVVDFFFGFSDRVLLWFRSPPFTGGRPSLRGRPGPRATGAGLVVIRSAAHLSHKPWEEFYSTCIFFVFSFCVLLCLLLSRARPEILLKSRGA